MSRYLLNVLPAVAFNVSIPIKVTVFKSLQANYFHSKKKKKMLDAALSTECGQVSLLFYP